MVKSRVSFKESRRIDFTGNVSGAEHFESFGEGVISLVRNNVLVVIDRGFGFENPVPHIVTDHLNLTGSNPLVGPNHPAGERFPGVNDIYVTDQFPGLPRGVAAGLKPGVVPTEDELKLIKQLGADFCCYNLVPTMLVAAHLRWKVLGIVVPEGVVLEPSVLSVLGNGGGK